MNKYKVNPFTGQPDIVSSDALTYTGDLFDSALNKIATIVNGLITDVTYIVSSYLLKEDGGFLLLESGDKIIL